MTLEPDYTMVEVADALGMSERWVRARVADGAEHQRYGHKIRFTEDQVEKLCADHAKSPTSQSITTGRKKKSA